MFNNKKILAIIPARGGTKRLPGKNILNLAGKPLIAWSIEAALGSKYIDRVIVSTDDTVIAKISREYGAEVPFIRPNELATDESSSVSVVLHAINMLKEKGEEYEYIMLLQPTSPLRTTENIDESLELLRSSNSDASVSVCEAEHSPLWSNTLPQDSDFSNFLDYSIVNKRSQDLNQYYRLNGAIYLCLTKRLSEEKTLFIKDKIIAYKMSQEQSIDIDNKVDFCFASYLISNQSN
jgi:CMP-N,N'-diacetyllegionaminic acid synthase